VPTLLFSLEDGVAKGSARSVGEVDVFAAISSAAGILTRFGGHKAAAGVTLPEKDLPEFERRLKEHLALLPEETFVLPARYEAELELGELGTELLAELRLLEPHGCGNRAPAFVARGVFMNDRKRVGKSGDHLKFRAFDGEASLPAIAFRCPAIEDLSEREGVVDVLFRLDENEWRGNVSLQLKVEDVAVPASARTPSALLVDELFQHAEEILAREDYALVGDSESFNTKLSGSSTGDWPPSWRPCSTRAWSSTWPSPRSRAARPRKARTGRWE
jgi:single-stranded-DNA-specific exonuclease